MIRLAICDDSAKDLQYVVKLVSEYSKSHYTEKLEVDSFSRSTDLIKKIQADTRYNAYILDIMMPYKNGIELGSVIREQQENAVIIYTSSSMDFALDAYGVYAQRYLVKPLERQDFFEALDYACTTSTEKKSPVFPFKTSEGIISIPFNTILYAECSSRMIHLICVDNVVFEGVYIRKNFEYEISALLEDSAFTQTHKSYAINFEHVEQYRTESFLMENGVVIPIARKRQSDVKRSYLKYLARNDR